MVAPQLRRAAGAVPTIVAFALLGAVGLWGQRHGWRFTPEAPPAPVEDWCPTHNVPDSRCIACHPELAGESAADWCKEHGVPESRCTACHPELLVTGKADDWCKEHGVPESGCTTCHPELAVIDGGPAPATDLTAVVAPAAPADRTITCQTHRVRVQFASADAVRKAGVTVTRVERRPMADRVKAPGEATFDRTRLARLAPRVRGTLAAVGVEVGDHVRAGQVLALVDASEVCRAKSDLLGALAQVDVSARRFERLSSTALDGVVTRTALEEAEGAARLARVHLYDAEQALLNLGLPVRVAELGGRPEAEVWERLRPLGLPDEAVALVGSSATTANLIPILAPFEGTVIGRAAVLGEVVEPSSPIVTVADVRRLWVTLQAPAEDQERLALGQRVAFRQDGAGFVVEGKVSFIGAELDETTRTLPVRAVVENPDGRLRGNAFGAGWITVRDTPEAVVVPDGAVHWEGCHHVVFVRLTEDIFQTRKVTVGVREGGLTEVLHGVLPGEVIADRGSHVLESELLKGKLGAGCCE